MKDHAIKLLDAEKLARTGGFVIAQDRPQHNRGWCISSPCGIFYLHRNGKVHDGIQDDAIGFWTDENDARRFYNDWRNISPPPLRGEWRHSSGVICCGTMRIANVDSDQWREEKKNGVGK